MLTKVASFAPESGEANVEVFIVPNFDTKDFAVGKAYTFRASVTTGPLKTSDGAATFDKLETSFALSYRAVERAASTGGGSSSGPGSSGDFNDCNQNRCGSLTSQCTGNVQAVCYCAAACACACAKDACESQNRAEATKLGTNCSY